jgi:hypothetical protein
MSPSLVCTAVVGLTTAPTPLVPPAHADITTNESDATIDSRAMDDEECIRMPLVTM